MKTGRLTRCPSDTEGLEALARTHARLVRLPRCSPPTRFERELDAHLEEVQELYDRLIRAHKPHVLFAGSAEPSSVGADLPSVPEQRPVASSNLIRLLDQKAPAAGGDFESDARCAAGTIASSISWKK